MQLVCLPHCSSCFIRQAMITAKELRPVDASGRPDLAERRRDEIIASDDDKAKIKRKRVLMFRRVHFYSPQDEARFS